MRVGWIGLGKLGLPCAAALAQHHDVIGYDNDRAGLEARLMEPSPWEAGLAELLRQSHRLHPYSEASDLEAADLILISVPTPHEPEYDGTHLLSGFGADFGYDHLVDALKLVATWARPGAPVLVVSTVSPGTARRHDLPSLIPGNPYLYQPSLIAMGTTIADFRNPELRLVGWDGPSAYSVQVWDAVLELYDPLDPGNSRLRWMSVAEAELTKMVYNTWVGLKIGFANTVAQLGDGIGADADVVMSTLEKCRDRVNSWSYMKPGMGDGGACHPRDQIVLNNLALIHDLDPNLFEAAIEQRQQHAGWLSDIVRQTWAAHQNDDRPVVILGYAYKPESGLDYGSPALLVARFLEELDPTLMDENLGQSERITQPSTILIGAQHERYHSMRFPAGSEVIDPFGYIVTGGSEVEVIWPGRRPWAPQWT